MEELGGWFKLNNKSMNRSNGLLGLVLSFTAASTLISSFCFCCVLTIEYAYFQMLAISVFVALWHWQERKLSYC